MLSGHIPAGVTNTALSTERQHQKIGDAVAEAIQLASEQHKAIQSAPATINQVRADF
jgi:hypothetical protein